MSNAEIAKLLRSVSAALSLGDNNRFRIIAYDRAADAIEHASSEVKDLWDEGKLKDLARIGEGIAGSLDELFKTGQVKHFEAILRPFPPAMFEMLDVPGIGPKNAFKLCQALGISKSHGAVAALAQAATKGHIRKLAGFGADSETKIIQNIREYQSRSDRLLLHQATAITDSLLAWLRASPYVDKAMVLGSLRRQASTVGDIDIAVATTHPQEVITHFTRYPQKSRVLEAGNLSASLILPNSRQVDLMVQPPQAFGSLLQHFTGSKHHNIALRELAMKKGYSLSEKGIKILAHPSLTLREGQGVSYDREKGMVTFATEESFYNFLGLDYIPPQLRENSGEIELALSHKLPKLVELADIRGDLHVHSNFDIEPSHDLGTSSVKELVTAAQKLNYQYLGLADHNPSVAGHNEKQVLELLKHRSRVIDHEKGTLHVFNGLEVDILPSGKRAISDVCMDQLDYAIVSIHSSFRGAKKTMTDRVLAGLDHPKAKIFGHPTARLLDEREGIDLDWDRLFDYCIRHHKWLEIDAWPNRLDLPDNLVREAVQAGISLVIGSDSHSSDSLPFINYGVSVAKRGWATAKDVMTTLDLSSIIKLINLR